jgi:glycosyltransferase involved in cell wall biosynthesis
MLFAVDKEENLLSAFATLVGNTDFRKKLATAGNRKASRQFDWERITDRLIRIYSEVVHTIV